MLIDYDILITYGGIARKFEKGTVIFHEGAMPFFYYQVITGEVKLFSTNNEGKELLQGIFKAGQSFGEPPLLLNKPYPSTAQTNADCTIVKIRKQFFQNILDDYPDIINNLLYTFAERIYDKAVAAQIWVQQTPENKIVHFLKKNKPVCTDSQMLPVPFTRQQIADFTGLRVETVIRTLMRMKDEGIVKIINHKLYY
ncbi:MAG: Crp/Fnr family transcriptional regulator [Chitinophagaceae bacterium]|nr:Crp/Fnr family transcriptional regulator [Chitinophagaceae bacterium]